MIIMSVDAGLARTGVAVCDQNETMAFPKEVITEYNADRLLQRLCDVAEQLNAQRIVVGLPKNMDGSLGERAQVCEKLAADLQEKSGIETVLFDERCTTMQAYTYLDMSGTHGKKRKKAVDAVAAVIILEDYLRSIK